MSHNEQYSKGVRKMKLLCVVRENKNIGKEIQSEKKDEMFTIGKC